MIACFCKIFTILTLWLLEQRASAYSCNITDLEKVGNICAAEVSCQNTVEFDVKTWECIKHTHQEQVYDYDEYYGRYRTMTKNVATYDTNYYLHVKIQNPHHEASLLNYKAHFVSLSFIDGVMVSVPEDIFEMENLIQCVIIGTNLDAVDLNKFRSLQKLTEIHLYNNNIKFIVNENTDDTVFYVSNVETIDISYNLLEALPNNFLSKFPKLRHLDLSHNRISSVGLLTFEGTLQLQTLDLSYNQLLGFDHAFARFGNLRELFVSHNNLSELLESNFIALTNLEILNVSSNFISNIQNNTFQNLQKLRTLDLTNNQIKLVSKYYFQNNLHLKSVFLANNKIQTIEENSFHYSYITEFSIENNNLSGTLRENTFKGLNIQDLNLSGGNIKNIENRSFASMINLNCLNLSSNSIGNIDSLAFANLSSLSSLDLSQNRLKFLDMLGTNLKNLTKLYIHHNKIENITNMLQNLTSLKELDMSHNVIVKIDQNSFLNVNNLTEFTVKGSQFVNVLHRNTFNGLKSVQKMDLSNTMTVIFKNESFSGLNSLTQLLCGGGRLTEIEYNAFLGTGQLQILNISYNQLKYYNVNESTLLSIREIHLNNNNITNIGKGAFSNLTSLRVLNLANNKLLDLQTDTFYNCKALTYLDLSFNKNMLIINNPFQNLSNLYSLSLEHVKKDFSFKNSSAIIENLDLKSCGIRNINKISIFNIHKLSYLNLSMNDILAIDKDTFKNMPVLVSLDLSYNKISYIQPGSFLHVKQLAIINLYRNDLSNVQFGVFDGIQYLRELNLSKNFLINLDVKLLPNVSHLYLDDNLITNLHIATFLESHLSKLSIGGNQISCQDLAELKMSKYSEKYKQVLTAQTLDYHSENIDGISCRTTVNDTFIPRNVTYDQNFNIAPLISALRNVVDKLELTLNAINDNTNITNTLKGKNHDLIQSIQSIIRFNNNSQTINNEYLSELTKINNQSNTNLEYIKKYLISLSDSNKRKIEDSSTNSTVDNQFRLELHLMIKQETDAMRREFRDALANIYKSIPAQQSLVAQDNGSKEDRALHISIYVIATCLTILLIAYLGTLLLKQITKARYGNQSHSRTVFSNSIEMD